MKLQVTTYGESQTKQLGERIGKQLKGGEVFVLESDLGGGKTTLVRGLAKGFGSLDPVASPSFTISYVYGRSDGKQLYHFDFYRLSDPGIMAAELAEAVNETSVVTAIEWAAVVKDVVPADVVTVRLQAESDTTRLITITCPATRKYLLRELESPSS